MPQTSTRICAGALRPATSVLTCRALPSRSGFSRARDVEVSSAAQIAAPQSFWTTRLKSVFIVVSPVCCCWARRARPLFALVAPEHALHRPRPSRKLPLARRLAHVGLEAVLQPPVIGEFGRLGIDAGLEAGKIGGAKCRRLLDHGAIDRRIEQ